MWQSTTQRSETKHSRWCSVMERHTTPTTHSWKTLTNLLKPNIQCANVTYSMWYSMPCQSLCITASLIILLNWVTPVWRWQMVRQNNASHFNAVQYCVTEQLSRIPSGSDPFLDSLNICTRIFQKRSRQMGRFDFTCLFCATEIFSVCCF